VADQNKSDFNIGGFNAPIGAVDYHTVNKYVFLDECFHGTGGFSGAKDKTYIVHSRSESEKKFWERVQRNYFKNFMYSFITAQYAPVFTEQVPTTIILDSNGKPFEDQESLQYSKWIKNVDGAGLNKNQSNANSCQSSYLKAVAYMVMDKAEDMLEPVVYLQGAETVDETMLIVDRFGRLQQIAFIVIDRVDQDGKNVYRRTIWTNDDVTVQMTTDEEGKDRKWKQVSATPLAIDSMPILPVFSQQRLNPCDYLPFPASSFKIAQPNTTLYNQTSEGIWHINRQSVATMVTDADVEHVGDGYSYAIKLESLTNPNPSLGFVNADTGIYPNHLAAMESTTNDIINFMVEEGVVISRTETAQAESGRAKEFTFRGQNAKLNNTVQMCVKIDDWMQEFYTKYNDPTGQWTAVTTYKTDYSIQDPVTMADMRDLIFMFIELGLVEDAKQAIKVARRQYTSSAEIIDKLDEELEDVVLAKEDAKQD